MHKEMLLCLFSKAVWRPEPHLWEPDSLRFGAVYDKKRFSSSTHKNSWWALLPRLVSWLFLYVVCNLLNSVPRQRVSVGEHGAHVCEDQAVRCCHCVFGQHGKCSSCQSAKTSTERTWTGRTSGLFSYTTWNDGKLCPILFFFFFACRLL